MAVRVPVVSLKANEYGGGIHCTLPRNNAIDEDEVAGCKRDCQALPDKPMQNCEPSEGVCRYATTIGPIHGLGLHRFAKNLHRVGFVT